MIILKYFPLEFIIYTKPSLFHLLYLGSEVCVKITTGTGGNNDGTLMVKIDTTVVATGHFTKGAVVTDKCFNDLQGITLSNPSDDAWSGTISITMDGKSTPIRCQGCTGQSLSNAIVVDGNADGAYHSSTQCLNGKICTISWLVTGK